jgi:hypothetical protein
MFSTSLVLVLEVRFEKLRASNTLRSVSVQILNLSRYIFTESPVIVVTRQLRYDRSNYQFGNIIIPVSVYVRLWIVANQYYALGLDIDRVAELHSALITSGPGCADQSQCLGLSIWM